MFGPLELGIILAIVLLLFGTKRLRSLGSDLGGAIRGFKKSIKDPEQDGDTKKDSSSSPSEAKKIHQSRDISAEAVEVEQEKINN